LKPVVRPAANRSRDEHP